MLRKSRVFVVIFFVISLAIFDGYHVARIATTDRTVPIIEMDSDSITVSVKGGDTAILEGVTATDAADGDVTDSIIVEAISPFTGTQHRIVTYAAFDSDNHVTHGKREIVYTDYVPSRFNLSKQLTFAMNSTNLLDGITVEDCIDGDITRSIRMMSDEEIDTAHVGEYPARLKVTNSAGGVSYLPITVEIHDPTVYYRLPQINLTQNVVYVEKGTDFDEEEFLDSITINGTRFTLTEGAGTYGASDSAGEESENTIGYDRVDIESEVDTDVSGYYEVLYSFQDTVTRAGTGKAKLYVVVTDRRNGTNE